MATLLPSLSLSERVPSPPFFAEKKQGSVITYMLSGHWTVHTLREESFALLKIIVAQKQKVQLHLDGITLLDTSGALALNMLVRAAKQQHCTVSLQCSNERYTRLLNISVLPTPEKTKEDEPETWLIHLLSSFGNFLCNAFWLLGHQLNFFGKFCSVLTKIIISPKKLRFTSLVFHMQQTGLLAMPIVGLLTFLIGMVVAYMGAGELVRFGAQDFAVNLLEVTVLREMGVLITAIVVAGRSSSAFTAQIGAMVANEEVAAINSMGLSSQELLVIPRVLALFFMLPVLVFFADIMSLLGGALALWYSIDLSLLAFIERYFAIAKLNNFFVGMIKAPFFALIIGIVGCYQGFNASGSAESVGILTTKSVVESIFLVILFDALFAIFFVTVGI